ncbi:MAG: hypothetical protein IJ138_09480 [Clostridia bacterium]|nr:hypothetical protein [Clostridia bacterium]
MKRIPFSQMLKTASVDLQREYDRLYGMFVLQKFQVNQGSVITLRDYCADNFANIPFRGTCISLDDFDDFYHHHYERVPESLDIDYLVSFCEYSYNLLLYNQGVGYNGFGLPQAFVLSQPIHFFLQHVLKVVDVIGYMPNMQDGITDFVPKNQPAISVAEIIDPSLSYKVIEYNHHSMKGDLERKKAVLLCLADKLEPLRKKLKSINAGLESDLFYLFNTVNMRHNNSDPQGQNYKPEIAALKGEEIEQWYDDTYEMCLLAFLELDHEERKGRIKQLKGIISQKETEQ